MKNVVVSTLGMFLKMLSFSRHFHPLPGCYPPPTTSD